MGEFYLMCNVVKCRQELKCQAWVTCCSHIFCTEHGQNSADKEKCSACGHGFSDRYDIVALDLNPSEQHKSMVLAGLNPEKVLDIANRALTFWTYQMYQERLYRDSAIKNAKQHAVALTDYCETVTAKHNMEIQKLGRDIERLQKDLEEKNKHVEELVSQLAEKSRILKNLQTQYDNLKRKTAENYISSNQEPASPPYSSGNLDFDMRSNPDGFKHQHSVYHPGEAYQYETSKPRQTCRNNNRNREFLFEPVTSDKPRPKLFNKFQL